MRPAEVVTPVFQNRPTFGEDDLADRVQLVGSVGQADVRVEPELGVQTFGSTDVDVGWLFDVNGG